MFEELKKMFIQEVKDLLDRTEKALLLLEKDPGNNDLVNEIYRHMHTIKGAAGMYGLEKTVEVAHRFEDLYKKIRERELAVDKEIIDISFKARDIILNLIENDEKNYNADEINRLFGQLDKYLARKPAGTAPSEDTEKQPQPPGQIKTYYILFEPQADIYERGVNLTAIIEDLHSLKNAVVTPFDDPSRQEQGLLPLFWEIIWAGEDLKQLDTIFIFVKDEITVNELCECDAFQVQGFTDFYKQLGTEFSPSRFRKLRDFLLGKLPEEKATGQQQDEQEAGEEILELEISQPDETGEETTGETPVAAQPRQQETFKTIDYIRIPSKQLDQLLSLVSQLIINNSQLAVAVENQDFDSIREVTEKFQTLISAIKDNTLRLRLVPINTLFQAYERLVRDLSQRQGKKIKFVTDGGETLIDKSIVEKLYTPLLHLIRNAVDHGIETPEEREKAGKNPEGMIRLIAFQSNINVIIQVQDDGRGIDPEVVKKRAVELGLIKYSDNLSLSEIYELIFTPGFTTATQISEISGRGMGMDAIRQTIRELRGNVEIDSEKGLGTSITIKLPATLSIIESLHVSTNNFHFLIPISNIITCEKIEPENIKTFSGNQIIFRDEPIPYVDIRRLFNLGGEHLEEENLIVVDLGTQKFGMIFEQIHGEISAVVKSLGQLFYSLEFFIGASILGDGSIAYIIDPYKIIKKLKALNNTNLN